MSFPAALGRVKGRRAAPRQLTADVDRLPFPGVRIPTPKRRTKERVEIVRLRFPRRAGLPAPFLPALQYACFLLLALPIGCRAPIGVDRIDPARVYEQTTTSALRSPGLSEFSRNVLWRYDLLSVAYQDPERAQALLREQWQREPDRDHTFALAELCYQMARDLRQKRHYLSAAAFAYAYLFGPDSAGAHDPFDPRFRLASDLYNYALTAYLRNQGGDAVLEPGVHEMVHGALDITVDRTPFPFGEQEFPRFVPANDFSVVGLTGRDRIPGLGAPLIAIRRPPESGEPRGYLAPRLRLPATAFLRIDLARDIPPGTPRRASLELYSPTEVFDIEVEGIRVPLEADLTAPLAHQLDDSPIWEFELGGFLSATLREDPTGLYMLQPYRPGKIPVIFIHGTASSPARWAEMLNGLQRHRELRTHFQFWFFCYTTGNVIPYSAQVLRSALEDAVAHFDAEGTDPALRQMVLVGHSQGGLLAKLQVIEGGDSLWSVISDRRLEEIGLEAEEEELVRRCIYFAPVPTVTRVVYIATPHRGSFRSGKWYARLLASWMSVRTDLAGIMKKLARGDTTAELRKHAGGEVPTSLASMDPENPFLQRLAETRPRDGVRTHSIIAVKGGSIPPDGDDGIVEYRSAHLDEAVSEYIVPVGHSCQEYALTIVEVRRILLEHLVDRAQPPGGSR